MTVKLASKLEHIHGLIFMLSVGHRQNITRSDHYYDRRVTGQALQKLAIRLSTNIEILSTRDNGRRILKYSGHRVRDADK